MKNHNYLIRIHKMHFIINKITNFNMEFKKKMKNFKIMKIVIIKMKWDSIQNRDTVRVVTKINL